MNPFSSENYSFCTLKFSTTLLNARSEYLELKYPFDIYCVSVCLCHILVVPYCLCIIWHLVEYWRKLFMQLCSKCAVCPPTINFMHRYQLYNLTTTIDQFWKIQNQSVCLCRPFKFMKTQKQTKWKYQSETT